MSKFTRNCIDENLKISKITEKRNYRENTLLERPWIVLIRIEIDYILLRMSKPALYSKDPHLNLCQQYCSWVASNIIVFNQIKKKNGQNS